ncbi:MAG: hypothetical protein ACLU30_15650 [Odoribacter splanchnicus]
MYIIERDSKSGFNYQDSEVEGRLASTWQQMYKAIANTNLVLKNLEGKQPGDGEF